MDGQTEQLRQSCDYAHRYRETFPEKLCLKPRKCLVCGSEAREFFNVFSGPLTTTESNRTVTDCLREILSNAIKQPKTYRSDTICKSCFSLIDEVDALEVRISSLKQGIISKYRAVDCDDDAEKNVQDGRGYYRDSLESVLKSAGVTQSPPKNDNYEAREKVENDKPPPAHSREPYEDYLTSLKLIKKKQTKPDNEEENKEINEQAYHSSVQPSHFLDPRSRESTPVEEQERTVNKAIRQCPCCRKGIPEERIEKHLQSCYHIASRKGKAKREPADGFGTQENAYECSVDRRARRKENRKLPVAECTLCGKVLSSMSINRHWVLVHNVKPFTCSLCEATFTGKQELKTHLFSHDQTDDLQVIMYKDALGTPFSKKRKLPVTQCQLCGHYVSNPAIKRHMKLIHELHL